MASDSQLYFTSTEIPLMGLLANGKKGRAIIASGSPAIKITDREGNQAVLVDGAIVPIRWDSPAFHVLFTEASDGSE
jgi:hypothetical protein